MMLCKSFTITFYDSMGKWFSDLTPTSITSFMELVRCFITSYSGNKPLKKQPQFILHCSRCREFVEAHINRFSKENIKISNFSNSIITQAFRIRMLRSLGLFLELKRMVPQIMEEAYEKAHIFVNLERDRPYSL